MVSSETFWKMFGLSRKIEEEKNNRELYKPLSYDNMQEVSEITLDNREMVIVNNPDSNNYHFELHKKR